MMKRSNSTTIIAGPSSMKGFLKKKRMWSNWKEGFFVLDGKILFEFKSEATLKPNKIYKLEKCTIKLAQNLTGAPYSFGLFRKKKDPVFLLAKDEPQMIDWVSKLSQQCAESEVNWKTDNYSPLLEGFMDAVVVASEHSIIIGVNDAALRLLGYSSVNDLIGKPLNILMPPHFAEQHDKYVQSYKTTGHSRLIGKPRNLPIVKADGTIIGVTLSLGEIEQNGSRRFVATMKPEDKKAMATTESFRMNLQKVIDSTLATCSTQLTGAIFTELGEMNTRLETMKARNAELSMELNRLKNTIRLDQPENDGGKALKIDTSRIMINQRLAERGGSGADIYLCNVDGWQCVLKEYDMTTVTKFQFQSITDELKLLESLPPHKNLVRYLFHEINEEKASIYMTRYSGTLKHFMTSKATERIPYWTCDMVVKMCLDIIRGLEILHEHNIIHRDLKSDNIFVTLNSRNQIEYLSIGDFDTAKHISEENSAKTTIGTPGYIAPEILQSRNKIEYTFSADIWSFGMVMYEIMALKKPFEDSQISKGSQLGHEGVVPSLSPQAEERYKSIVPIWKKCLDQNPIQRPTTSQLKTFFASLI